MGYNPSDIYSINEFFDGISSDPIESSSLEQCSMCSMKFTLPKQAHQLIPIHCELFSSRCGGSGKEPRRW